MALSDHIGDLITAYKAQKSNERRNRILSHLKDAHAHAIVDELEEQDRNGGMIPTPEAVVKGLNGCTCRPGMIDNSCPTHGK